MRECLCLYLREKSAWCLLNNQVMKWSHFRGGPGNLWLGVFALFFWFAKQPLSVLSKHGFSEILVYFKIHSHLLEFPSIRLFLKHLNLWHLKCFICMISEFSDHGFSFQEQERSWTKSKILYFLKRHPFIKMSIRLLK